MGGKFTDTAKADYLDMLRQGNRRMAAAEAIDVAYSTIWRAMKADDDFARAVELAERRADEEVEDALYQAAISGNLTAIQVWLYNRWPDRWKDQRGRAELHRVAASVNEPIVEAPEEDEQPRDDPGEVVAEAANPDRVIELSKWIRESREAG